MYFTFAWFDNERMFASGRSATIPFTRGNLFTMDPNSCRINRRSNGPGAWLYCTTTLACDAEDACRSGDSLELSAYARVTLINKQTIKSFFIVTCDCNSHAELKAYKSLRINMLRAG